MPNGTGAFVLQRQQIMRVVVEEGLITMLQNQLPLVHETQEALLGHLVHQDHLEEDQQVVVVHSNPSLEGVPQDEVAGLDLVVDIPFPGVHGDQEGVLASDSFVVGGHEVDHHEDHLVHQGHQDLLEHEDHQVLYVGHQDLHVDHQDLHVVHQDLHEDHQDHQDLHVDHQALHVVLQNPHENHPGHHVGHHVDLHEVHYVVPHDFQVVLVVPVDLGALVVLQGGLAVLVSSSLVAAVAAADHSV